MRSIYCVTARYEDIRKGACEEKALVRVMADGKALFCEPDAFTDPKVLPRIPVGSSVYMGVQSFADGTFWLHWLHSPEYGTAEPPTSTAMARKGALWTGVGLMLSLGGGWESWAAMEHGGAFVVILCMVAFIFGICAFGYGAHSLLVAVNRGAARLRAFLRDVKGGKTDMCVPLSSLFPRDADDGGLGEILEESAEIDGESDKALFQADGVAERVKAYSFSRGSGKYRQDFLRYIFVCAGRALQLTMRDDTPLFHPLFRKTHPFMLAEGDRVRAVVGNDASTVKALRNDEDGCVYLFTNGMGRKSARVAFHALWGIPLATTVLGALIPFLSDGIISVEFLQIMAGGGLACGVFVWLLVSAVRRFGSYRADLPLIIKAFDLDTAKGKKKPYIHEL